MTAQRVVLSIAMAVALTLTVQAQVKERAEVALQAAIKQELVNGDLAGAIKQYEAIVSTYCKTNRPVAAQSLLRMAEAYQKQGDAQAQSVYARIVKDYSDQPEALRQARANLRTPVGGGSQALGPRVVRRLDGATELSLSPDGRTLAMYGLALQDVATGSTRRLNPNFSGTPEELKKADRVEDAEWPVLTHDSKQVAYQWYVWDGTKWTSELRAMSTEPGGRPRPLVSKPEFNYLIPVAWAPDARSVLVEISQDDQTTSLAWVSAADGSVTPVESLGWRLSGRASLSADGRYIAYSALTVAPEKGIPAAEGKLLERHIYVMASDGSNRSELTLTAGVSDRSPVWTADGSAIVFLSNRSGTFGLWSIPVKDGKAAGPASMLRSNVGEAELVGIAPAGTLYYGTSADVRTVSIVSLTRGAATTSRVTDTMAGYVPSWSPDGKTVAVARLGGEGGSALRLVLHSVESGQERSYSRDGLLAVPVRWFKDGRKLLVAVAEKPDDNRGGQIGGPSAWYSLDRQTGAWARVLPGDPLRGPVFIAPDDQTIYYISYNSDARTRAFIFKMDLNTGTRTQVFDSATLPKSDLGVGPGLLSPDGRMWALAYGSGEDNYLDVIDLQSGQHRDLQRPHEHGDRQVTGLRWSSDSRMIYWVEAFSKDGGPRRLRIMQMAASGGPVEFSGIELDGADSGYPEMSPSGSLAALATYNRNRELWALDLSSLTKSGAK